MALTIRQALRRAEEELADVEARAESQRRVVEGLRTAVERYGDREARDTSGRDPNLMPRTDAVLAVLGTSFAEPFTVSQLVPLVGALRDTVEEGGAISAALSYLKDRGKVRMEPGQGWMLSDAPPLRHPGDIDPDDIPF